MITTRLPIATLLTETTIPPPQTGFTPVAIPLMTAVKQPIINIAVIGDRPTPEPPGPPMAMAAPGLPVGVVSTPVGVANPTSIGGTVINVPSLDEGLSQGFDQGTSEGIDNVDMSPRSLTVDIGLNTPPLRIDPNVLGQIQPSTGPRISFAPPTGGNNVDTPSPPVTAPQLQIQAPDLAVVRNIVGSGTPAPEAPITDINRYKTSSQTQTMIKYALIAGVIGLVVWYFFFRGGSKSE